MLESGPQRPCLQPHPSAWGCVIESMFLWPFEKEGFFASVLFFWTKTVHTPGRSSLPASELHTAPGMG